MDLIYYVLIGVFAGFFAGLLGIGGGLLIVPALAWKLHEQPLLNDHFMHVAVATSLAVIVVTSLSSMSAHAKRGTIDWLLFWRLVPGLVLGSVIGAVLATRTSNEILRVLFAVFELFVAIQIFSSRELAINYLPRSPTLSLFIGVGLFIGVLSALVGVGGGVLMIPFMCWCHVPLRTAISTSAALGFPLALSGSLAFLVLEFTATPILKTDISYIYWPAFFSIAIASVLSAPVGATLAHLLPASMLKSIFAIFLASIGLAMLFI